MNFRLSFFLFSFITSGILFPRVKKMTIEQALKSKAASVQVNNVTGYSGKCLGLKVLNLLNDSLCLKITPGWIFDSDDSTKQDLLVVKEFLFALSAGQSKSDYVFANCCQKSKISPVRSKFSKNRMANSELKTLAEFLNEGDYDSKIVCNAVWAVSDNAPISNICGGTNEKDLLLRKKVSEIKRKAVPWYNVITETKELADGRIETVQKSLYGEFTCNLSRGTEFNVSLKDRHGREIMILQKRVKTKDDLQNYYVEFFVEHLPKKEFFITVTDIHGVDIIKKPIDLRL